MATRSSLSEYAKKRDFTKTPEPGAKKKKAESSALFVIQKHEASHLHYDFRLLIQGVLVSWAIPKEPPQRAGIKRLAIQTEDHPRDYAHFEGVIPPGNYGAGTVMVWDMGTFHTLKDEPIEESLAKGRIEIVLEGKKIHGAYALIRTHFAQERSKPQWLFFKMKEPKLPARKAQVHKDKSALTNRTMAQIRKASS